MSSLAIHGFDGDDDEEGIKASFRETFVQGGGRGGTPDENIKRLLANKLRGFPRIPIIG